MSNCFFGNITYDILDVCKENDDNEKNEANKKSISKSLQKKKISINNIPGSFKNRRR